MTVESVLAALGPYRQTASGWSAHCPAHEDRNPSLSVSEGDRGIVLHCHAGCSVNNILAAVGLTWADLRGDGPVATAYGEPGWEMPGVGVLTDVYRYLDRARREAFQVCRFRGPDGRKAFRQRHRQGDRWVWKAPPEAPIYRLPDVLAAIEDGHPIFIAEGEKDVDALVRAGVAATTNPQGAGKWRSHHTAQLAGAARVVVVADRDEPGRRHAREVAKALREIVTEVVIVEPVAGKDAYDHLAAGLTVEQLEVTFDSTVTEASALAPDITEYLAGQDPPEDWVIPGVLEHGDRLLLTGYEGEGKSMLTRQMAVTTAVGVPPFMPPPLHHQRTPASVLVIDCENGEKRNRRHFRMLVDTIGLPSPAGRLRIIDQPRGIDLCDDEWRVWLLERVTAHRPDLLIIGPWYRLSPELERHEGASTRVVIDALDAARQVCNSALIIELHVPNEDGSTRRSLRPIGPSVIRRWPEFGLGMRPEGNGDVAIESWRGARDERSFPTRLSRGRALPWLASGWPGRRP